MPRLIRKFSIFPATPVLFTLLVTSLFFFTTLTSDAATLIPATPKIKAKGYLLIDFNSGRVLAEKKSDERLEPASLTKMLTSYVVAYELANGNISMDDEVRISNKAWRMQGSRMFVEVGKKVSVENYVDLVEGFIQREEHPFSYS